MIRSTLHISTFTGLSPLIMMISNVSRYKLLIFIPSDKYMHTYNSKFLHYQEKGFQRLLGAHIIWLLKY